MTGVRQLQSETSILERYRKFLPLTEKTRIITLGEGFTPLVRARNLARELGREDLKIHLKLEGLNPTGSFKDRGMCMAITRAVEEGSKAVICASTGNTSASAAAFSAQAGLKCFVLLPAGNVAMGKLAQAILYGSRVIQINGNFDRALELVKEIGESYPVTIVNSINPYRLEGQKTGAFEIIESLGDAPDYLAIPVGNAGNITAYFRGFKLWYEEGKSTRVPKMCGFQAAGAAPIVLGRPVENPETIATAIRIGNPASWEFANSAIDESGGMIDSVTDEEILEAYKMVAALEGVFCEPASAASIAGLKKSIEAGRIAEDKTVACILTGNGLKDPKCALEACKQDLEPVEANLKSVIKAMGI